MVGPNVLRRGAIYDAPTANMLLRVIEGDLGPGVIPLSVARQFSENAEALLDQRLDYLEACAVADERAIADGQAAMAAMQKAVAALKTEIVPLYGAISLPTGLSLGAGKTTRAITVAGVRKNDNLVVTPNAAFPAQVSMGEAYCLNDGTLSVVLINTAALGLSITTAQSIPLGIIALRPTS